MYLELELSDGQHLLVLRRVRMVAVISRRWNKGVDEGGERFKLGALDVDLEYVDEVVPVLTHEALEGERRRRGVGRVRATQCEGEEMRACPERGVVVNLWAERRDAEVVAPDLALRCGGEESGFEGGLAVHAERVYGAWCALAGYPLESADPFAAIAECADTFDTVGAAEGGREKVPWK